MSTSTTTTTTLKPCIINSVTLQAGESFVLPPGAQVISVTNQTALTSVDNCLDLTQVETPVCYCFQIISTESSGVPSMVYNEDNVYIKALYLSNTDQEYAMTELGGSPAGGWGNIYAGIISSLEGAVNIGATISGACVTQDSDGSGPAGNVITVCFKTVPSIGNYLFLKLETAALLNPDFVSTYYLPAQLYDATEGTKCACTTV